MIKQFFKKVLISYLIIICCIYTPTAQAAGWSFGGYNFGNGSLNIVKDGVKITTAPVSTAPITSNLASKIASGALRGVSFISALSLAVGIASDAIDWVLDPANNSIRYKRKDGAVSQFCWYGNSSGKDAGCYPTLEIASEKECAYHGGTFKIVWKRFEEYAFVDCQLPSRVFTATIHMVSNTNYDTSEKSIPISTVANKIYDMAKSGNASAQADVTSAVTELVNSGTYDTPISQAIQDAINNGTLPKDTDTNTNNPTNPQIDTSSIINAIRSLATSLATELSNGFNGIKSVINTSIDKILNKQDQIQGELVNTGSKIDAVGGKVVGVQDAVKDVGGKVVGVQDAVKDVGGKVVGLNDSVDKVGDKVVGVGDKVTAVGDKLGTKVDAVGDKVTGVGVDVRGVGDKVTGVGVDVRGVGDKVTGVGEKVGEKVDAVGDKVTDAIKDQTDEITKKMDETKPKDFELPAFCSWASKVCDFIDWVKQPNDDAINESVDIQTPDMPKMESTDISFGGQCPQNFDMDIDLFGKPVKFTLFDSNMFCQFLSDWIRIPVIFAASLTAVYILGGRARD